MPNKTSAESSSQLMNDLKTLLLHGVTATQESLCEALAIKGHKINQSKTSRLLRKINAIKYKNDQGEMVYRLPHDMAPPPIHTTLGDLIIDIVANETTIIIKTSPGSASLIARIIDNKECHILGTIAGDDAIFVAPESVAEIATTLSLICSFLNFSKD